MNRYALAGVIVVAVLVALALVGSVLLHLFRPDASATFITQTTQLIGLVTVAAGVFYGFSKQKDQLEGIERNVNGKMTAKDDRIAQLERMALDNGYDPQTGHPITGTTDVQQ